MAKFLNKDPQIYNGEKERFMRELKSFHESKGTPFQNVPCIGGKEIDLYLLYWLVTAQGGWERINSRAGWDDLLPCFELSESTLNAALGVKHVYVRHLEPYEKAHFQGEEEDREDEWFNDEEDPRARRQKAQKLQATIPVAYNHSQHNITDEMRSSYGLSRDLVKRTDYDKLILSLLAPLPNEQDFAINICSLLSNEGKHLLNLGRNPKLLNLILGHAGVFQHADLLDYLGEIYRGVRNLDMNTFWQDVCRDDSIRELLLHPETSEGSFSAFFKRHSSKDERKKMITLNDSSMERLKQVQAQAQHEVSQLLNEEDELFAVGRMAGPFDALGHRVLQVASIIWNLSFEEYNVQTLAKSLTCLRFCLLCANSNWRHINQIGFDVLCNIATDLVLESTSFDACINEVLFSTITSFMKSVDRYQIISSLDILSKLCQVEANESLIGVFLSRDNVIYEQLVSYLSLHDIHLLISTLECMYSISCHGENTCNAIVRTHGALEMLVSLVTVEAQSYGPKACILMRVVETVTGGSSGSQSNNSAVPVTITQTTNGLKADQLAQLGQLTPLRPQSEQSHTQLVTMTTTPSQQVLTGIPVVGQGNVIRGQLVQVVTPGGQQQTVIQQQTILQQPQAGTVLHLPRHPVPLRPNGQTTVLTSQANTVISQHSQPFQLQRSQGNIIFTSANNSSQQIVQYQQPNGIQVQSTMQQYQQNSSLKPATVVQSVARPVLTHSTGQPVTAQQSGSQQVQLRVCNDDANRQLCLSWLKATYELGPGSSIEQQIMYKQYLASLHKLGKREVISAQHYAVCVRTLFGGSVGPNRKTMPDGSIQSHYEGVKVRQNQLPLRFVGTQLHEDHNQTVSTTFNSTITTASNQPGSPILTNLLHGKASASENDTTQEETIDSTTHKDLIKAEMSDTGGLLVNLLDKKPENHMVNGFGQKIIANHQVNGVGGIKRPADSNCENDQSPPTKRPLFDCNGSGVTNGSQAGQENNGFHVKVESGVPQTLIVNNHQPVVQFQLPQQAVIQGQSQPVTIQGQTLQLQGQTIHLQGQTLHLPGQHLQMQSSPQIVIQPHQLMPGSQKIVTGSDGKQYLIKAAPASTNSTVMSTLTMTGSQAGSQQSTQHLNGSTGQVVFSSSQPGTGNKVFFLQPNSKVIGANGQVVVQNSAPTPTMVRAVTAQPQPQQGGSTTPMTVTNSTGQQALVTSVVRPTLQAVQQTPTSQTATQTAQSEMSASNAATVPSTATTVGSTAVTTVSPVTIPKPDPANPFLCEWNGCLKAFKSPREVERHAITEHCPEGSDDIPCLWLRCDGLKRKRFSLMTHLQDRHCHPQIMKLMALRRVQIAQNGKSEVPLPPPPPPHPGYAPNAAIHAIKRHAQEFATPKAAAMGDEKEGPVTKSIRLTASLILKNLVMYSNLGKKRLRCYESHLSNISLSNVESSRTISQILFEISDYEDVK